MKIKSLKILACLVLIHGSVNAENGWTMFRGPQGNGLVIGSQLPTRWSETENVLWKTTVIRAGRTFEKLAENRLESGFMASPSVVGDSLILRTKTHLYRIGKR